MSRESHARANMRGGLGVRKRLSEESLRDTYKLNGVRSGFAVARCYDKYGRWEYGYTIGVIVRKTSSVVQVRWADDPDEIHTYNQGDARYEVDRNRWRILGMIQGNPLDPDNPMAAALTGLMGSGKMPSSANDADSTDRGDTNEMTEKQSKASKERAAAKAANDAGSLTERDTYTAKQVATRCGTDSKTMRKFFRTEHSTVEPVGQGGRYEFDAGDMPKIKREFDAWVKRSQARSTRKPSTPQANPKPSDDMPLSKVADAIERAQDEDDIPVGKRRQGPTPIDDDAPRTVAGWIDGDALEDREPTDEELAEMDAELEGLLDD